MQNEPPASPDRPPALHAAQRPDGQEDVPRGATGTDAPLMDVGAGRSGAQAVPTTVMVVSQQDYGALGLQRSLQVAGYQVPPIAATDADALACALSTSPDLAVVDVSKDVEPARFDLARRLRVEMGIGVVFVAGGVDPAAIAAAARARPLGYLVEPFDSRQLVATVSLAVERVRHEVAGSPAGPGDADDRAARLSLLERKLQQIANVLEELGLVDHRVRERPPEWEQRLGLLTPREWEVLRRLRATPRVSSIATTLGVSPHTVRNHLKSIFRKLGVNSQAQLLATLAGAVVEPLER